MPDAPLILVDCFNLAFRSAFSHRGLTHEGRPTGLYHGFLSAVHMLRKLSPNLVFCWDQGLPGDPPRPCWHQVLFPDYKKPRRDKMLSTAELDEKMAERAVVLDGLAPLYEALCWLGYPHVGVPGLEADDIIGVLSAQTSEPVLIYSTDHDMYQLLTEDDRVRILRPGKTGGKHVILTAAQIEKEYGVPVDRWATYLALGGDKSDHIKPAPGMGPVTAAKLTKAGADLWRAFEENPTEFRRLKQAVALAPIWRKVKACFSMARIPRKWQDPRLTQCSLEHAVYRSCVPWNTPRDARLQHFIQFCSMLGLVDMISKRHDLVAAPRIVSDGSVRSNHPPAPLKRVASLKTPEKPILSPPKEPQSRRTA